jgi:hypothetical protein
MKVNRDTSWRPLGGWLMSLLLVFGLGAGWVSTGATKAMAATPGWTLQTGSPSNVQTFLVAGGTLYAGTSNGSNDVWEYASGKWTQMSGSPSNVQALTDVNGTLYAGTGNYNNDVWVYNGASWTQMTSGQVPMNVVTLLYASGTLYAGTVGEFFDGWAYNNGTWANMLSSPSLIQSLLDVNGTLFAGSRRGSGNQIWSYNLSAPGRWTQMVGSPNSVYSLVLDASGTVYAGTWDGPNAVWSYANGKWTLMSGSPSNVQGLIDVKGTLYAGTFNHSNDVWSYSNGKWAQMSGSPSNVYALTSANGTLYAATSTGVWALPLPVPTPGSPGPFPPFINTIFFMENPKVGTPYSVQLAKTGGMQPFAWSISSGSLPKGLTLNNQGVISGTPTGLGGEYTFTVKVMDANKLSATRQLTLTVDGPTSRPSIALTYPAGFSGGAFSQTLSATGGSAPYTWTLVKGALPTDLSVNAQTGEIQGTAMETGLYPITVKVSDAYGQIATQPLVVDVLHPYQREIVWNGQIQNVPAVVRSDAGTQTTYMPIWYVMQLLKSMGIASSWNGHDWNLTTSGAPNLSNIQAGTGSTSIYLNGTLVQNVNTVAATDPSTNRQTTYMPIWYVQQILNRVGLTSTWNGMTWMVTQKNS